VLKALWSKDAPTGEKRKQDKKNWESASVHCSSPSVFEFSRRGEIADFADSADSGAIPISSATGHLSSGSMEEMHNMQLGRGELAPGRWRVDTSPDSESQIHDL